MAEETIFSKIIRREVPADIVYQDELVTAFRDISPKAPTHVLIVPNILVPTANDVSEAHEQAMGRMFTVAAKIAKRRHCRRRLPSDRQLQSAWRAGSLPYSYARSAGARWGRC